MDHTTILFKGDAPDLTHLVNAAYRSFQVIEPWSHASCTHPAIQKLITDIQKQGHLYYDALDMSIKVVEQGYTFCTDSEDLCEFLLNDGYTVPQLQEFIGSMRQIADNAQRDALATLNMFRSVRKGLIEISARISTQAQDAEQHSTEAARSGEIVRAKRDQFLRVILVSQVLLLPVVLPILLDSFFKYADKLQSAIQQREKERLYFEDIVRLLHKASADVEELLAHVDVFSDWWGQVHLMLNDVEKKVAFLREVQVTPDRIRSATANWRKIKSQYSQYKKVICRLQDHYPSTRPPARLASS